MKLLRRVVLDDAAPYGDRIKAAQLIMERVLGKAPERVQFTVAAEDPPWLKALRVATVVGEIGEPVRAGVIDAEVIEDDFLPDDV